MNVGRILLNCGCCGLLFFCSSRGHRGGRPSTYVETDVVNLNHRYQIIDNFGASDAWTMKILGTWSDTSRSKVADLLFSTDRGIGLSLWRFNIGGGTNRVSINNPDRSPETFETGPGQYDWTRQAGELWFARAARARGVPYLLGFVNSPPGRMTRSGLTNSNDDQISTTNLKPGFEGQYASYLCDIIQHFRSLPDPSQQLVFNYLSPVNEPQNDWIAGVQEGNRASNDDVKRIFIALHDELVRRQMDTHIRGIESCLIPDLWRLNADATAKYKAPYGDYLKAFLGDPAIAPMLDHTLCYHDYSSYTGPAVEADHRNLGRLLARFAGAKLWMSETCILDPGRDLGMTTALNVAKLIHADLALAHASAWQWWTAVSKVDFKDGLLYTDWKKPGDPESILISKTFWALGNFSRFVRPGMHRIELSGEDHSFKGLLASAYWDDQTHTLVMVYINLGRQLRQVRWDFTGFASGQAEFTPYLTTETQDLAPAPQIPSQGVGQVPAHSIVTFVGQFQ